MTKTIAQMWESLAREPLASPDRMRRNRQIFYLGAFEMFLAMTDSMTTMRSKQQLTERLSALQAELHEFSDAVRRGEA